jgi:putative SOS response-associated peptidase YedK
VLGAGVANTIWASGLAPRKQAGHLIASDRVRNLLAPYKRGAVHICNLYRMTRGVDEVARLFGAKPPATQLNFPEEVFPGYPGLVIRDSVEGRVLEQMTWGFPLRLKGMKPESKPKPVNNIADLRKPMWSGLARKPQWRCLIPLTGFCEAQGQKGAKTRTWLSEREQLIFAWGGLWRVSDEWGPVFSGAMTDCNEAVRPVHNRMPVMLAPGEWESWLHGSFEEVCDLQARCYPDDLIAIERTPELWGKRS